MTKSFHKYQITELIEGYKKNFFSPTDVIEDIVKRLKKINTDLNAFVYFDEELVYKQARDSTKRLANSSPRGSLEGIPISIKDLIVTKDMPTTRGSYTKSLPVLSDYDAPVVSKLKNQGAIILGKTASPEFGHKGTTKSRRFGETNNPWNLNLNSGGSSGGSCAAVASGLGPASIGTDGGGSIRIPCSFCRLFGHKPTFGKIPAYPISPFGTIANLGPITRTVMDSAIIMNSIASPDNLDWHSLPSQNIDYSNIRNNNILKKLKVGYSKFWGMEKFFDTNLMDKVVVEKIEETISCLEKSGLAIREYKSIEWPHNPYEIFMVMWQAGAANLARKINKGDFNKIDPTFLNLLEKGNQLSMFDLMDAETKRAENASHMKKVFNDVNLLIGPTLPVLPFNTKIDVPLGFRKNELFSWLPFTYPFNLTKNPACNINVNYSKSGLPIGMQIVGDIYDDKTCFELAFLIEEIMDISDKWPNL